MLRVIAELFAERRGQPLQITDVAIRSGLSHWQTLLIVDDLVAGGWIAQESAGAPTHAGEVPHPRMSPDASGPITGVTGPGWATLDALAHRQGHADVTS